MRVGKRLFTLGKRSNGLFFWAQRAGEEVPVKDRGHATHTAPRCLLSGCPGCSPERERTKMAEDGWRTSDPHPRVSRTLDMMVLSGTLYTLSCSRKLELSQTFMNFNAWHFRMLRRFEQMSTLFQSWHVSTPAQSDEEKNHSSERPASIPENIYRACGQSPMTGNLRR